MKRSLWIVILIVVLAGFAGFQQYSSWSLNKPKGNAEGRSEEASEGQSGGRPQGRSGGRSQGQSGRSGAVPVTVATVIQKNMPVQLAATGTVEAYATVSIRAQVGGVITKVSFTQGQDVKQGDPLFTIDARPLEAALKQAEANLQRDTAQLQNSREQARRYAELVKKQYVSQEQFDQIKTNADALESVVDADKAAVENAKVQLSYCYIFAPVDGRTGSLLVNQGNVVRTNDATPLVVINQVNPIYVTFSLPEGNLPEIKARMAQSSLKVLAILPQSPDNPEQGNLTFVDNAVDATTGTIKFKGTFANAGRRLWPGQFVKVLLNLTEQPNAVVIPFQAIQSGQDTQLVFVVKPDRTVEVRPIVVSRTLNGEAVVTKGLTPGETIVTDGQFLLSAGSRVQIKKGAES
jgi:membrane fusion protein, multidrug efflux system